MVELSDIEDAYSGLADRCKKIGGYDVNSLMSSALFTHGEMKTMPTLLNETINAARKLQDLPVERLPENKYVAFDETAKKVSEAFRRLHDFSSRYNDDNEDKRAITEEWQPRRGDFIRHITESCSDFLNHAFVFVPYLAVTDRTKADQESKFEKSLLALEEQTDAALTDVREKAEEIDRIATTIRATAAQAAIAHHATIFGGIASEHDSAGKKWLAATIALFILTGLTVIAALFLFPPAGELRDVATIQRIVAKLVVVSILYYMALWASKNYRTHRHLAVLNSHRQSALQTFDAFVKAASGDEPTKNAVLLEATRCIFAPANTGYLGAEDDTHGDRIIEIVKTVSGAAK